MTPPGGQWTCYQFITRKSIPKKKIFHFSIQKHIYIRISTQVVIVLRFWWLFFYSLRICLIQMKQTVRDPVPNDTPDSLAKNFNAVSRGRNYIKYALCPIHLIFILKIASASVLWPWKFGVKVVNINTIRYRTLTKRMFLLNYKFVIEYARHTSRAVAKINSAPGIIN